MAAKPRLRERSFDDYSEKLDRYVRRLIGGQKLSEVRSFDVQSIYSTMAERDLSPRTIRYTHAILTSAFKQAVKWNMLVRNPCDAVELPRMVRKEMQALSPEQVNRFLTSALGETSSRVWVLRARAVGKDGLSKGMLASRILSR